ncbi:MAG: hypothetical protein EBR82_47005 [Caulobacteraceae bacterium]|nr:hypothetical protein [Caulobacteraceae bacterium]
MQYHYVVIWDTEEQCFKLDVGTTIAHFEDREIFDGFSWLGIDDFPAIRLDYNFVSDKLAELCGDSC